MERPKYVIESREDVIRELFEKARKSYPKWSHMALLRLVWAKRPAGTTVNEMLRIAEEFKR
ncbi:hypothetical protein Q2941_25345 [Bradyrhizobium sp. UFLA05-153]